MSNYKGESFGKKIARAAMWGVTLHNVNHSYQIYTGLAKLVPWHMVVEDAKAAAKGINDYTYMVLASEECGDLSTLTGFGVRPENIVAVDVNTAAIRAVRRDYPGATPLQGDVVDIARDLKKEDKLPSIVYLDWCGVMSTKTILDTYEIMQLMSPGDYLAVTMMKGRENDFGDVLSEEEVDHFEKTVNHLTARKRKGATKKRNIPARKKKKWKKKSAKRGVGTRIVDDESDIFRGAFSSAIRKSEDKISRYCLRNSEKYSYASRMAASGRNTMARIHTLNHILDTKVLIEQVKNPSAKNFNCGVIMSSMAYHSGDGERGKGSPMFTVIMAVQNAMVLNQVYSSAGDALQQRIDGGMNSVIMIPPTDKSDFAKQITREPQFEGSNVVPVDLAAVYNISKGTLAAYRAHATRGTYGYTGTED